MVGGGDKDQKPATPPSPPSAKPRTPSAPHKPDHEHPRPEPHGPHAHPGGDHSHSHAHPAPPHAGAPRPHEERRRRRPAGSESPSLPPSAGNAAPPARPERASAEPWSIDQFVVPPQEGKVRFHDFDLPPDVMRGVADLNFEYCTPIQGKSLPHSLAGRDVAGRAQTGTGKTAAFLISAFTHFFRTPAREPRRNGAPRALVLAPTRELVMQIIRDANSLGYHCPFRYLAVFGGMQFREQQAELAKPVDLVAATPGRLLDFSGRGKLDLSQVEMLVIDEADRMLDMGFIPDIRRIVRQLPPREKRQNMLFSATLSEDVLRLASQWMRDPVFVEIQPEKVTLDTIKQTVYAVPARDKLKLLLNLIETQNMQRVLVFRNRRDTSQELAESLRRHHVSCALISGIVPQEKRIRVLEDFRSGRVRVLVATDVAARGLHVDSISHVINYDLPFEAEDYVHRIGRTGRVGAEGAAITFAGEDDAFMLPALEKYIGRSLDCIVPEDVLLAPPTRHPLPPGPREPTTTPRGRTFARDGRGSGGGRRRPPSRR